MRYAENRDTMINTTMLVMQIIIVTLTLFSGCVMIITLLSNRKRLFFDPKPLRFPTVTIGVPAYNKASEIEATLNSLLVLDYPHKPEIIVVDDGSTDKTIEIVRKFGNRVKLILMKKNSGRKAVPLNVALKHAKGELFGFIDADTIMDKNALKAMVGYFNNENVAAVMPAMKTLSSKSILERLQRIEYMITILSRKMLTFLNALFITPGCAVFRTNVLRKLGGFDEHDITEDLEIGLRLRKAGWSIENSLNAVVWTDVPSSFRTITRQRVRWYRGMIHNLRKYWGLIGQHNDLGVFVMPFMLLGGVASVLLFCGLMAITIYDAIGKLLIFVFAMILSGWDPSLFGTLSMNSQPNIFVFMSILFIAIFGVNFYFSALASHQSKRKCILDAILFILIYTPLFGFWWILTIIQEIMGSDRVW